MSLLFAVTAMLSPTAAVNDEMLEKEDPEYVSHRKAQFLICKTMKEFELRKRRRCRIRKLKSKLNARMWILGNPIKIEGSEFSNKRAVYICNHASPLAIFLVMWLTPTGTVGIAKKEIVWYPLFGQLYVLANHLRIDRSNPSAAIESMKEVARALVKQNLSLIIFPEGTRSKTGRLLPFKKGFIHIALQSRLPIVPMVVSGTHLAWRKDSLRVRPAPLTVKYLRPIKTEDWEVGKIGEYVDMIHGLYVDHLPESQRPL
ncbi:1-acyl-sn-glycerol-3-phosphate acyltransferase-like [Asparagus officinalis]|uniref:1-acyl-sn-glycerol-3-phosphate acyltransferase-like n=1 Tax=Asparagus officinalis TaxID=4686 RepID=UPI00098E86CC|nr:1-acyl-sn-glycerol-3-phosphate acyltransferase-like [Asparagus officinalis]